MVRSAYSSGKPAYGVGAGNATIIIDETAMARETRWHSGLLSRRIAAKSQGAGGHYERRKSGST